MTKTTTKNSMYLANSTNPENFRKKMVTINKHSSKLNLSIKQVQQQFFLQNKKMFIFDTII